MITILWVVASSLAVQYALYRCLREDYHEKFALVRFLWLFPLMFFVSGWLSFVVLRWNSWDANPMDVIFFWHNFGFVLPVAFAFTLSWTGYFAYALKWKWNVLLEDITSVWLLYLIAWSLFLNWWILGAVMLGAWLVTKLVGKHYRGWWLYESGRKGFLFWLANLIVSLVFSGISAYFANWLGMAVLVWAVVSFMVLWWLGRNKI